MIRFAQYKILYYTIFEITIIILIGIFGKIQLKVNKKLGNVEIKAYFCRLNKYITLKTRRLWQ